MNDKQTFKTGTVLPPQDREFNLIDALIVVAGHKRLVLGLPVLIACIAIAISFAFPDIYRANTKVLPPQQGQSGAAALLAQLGGVAANVAGAAGIKNPGDVYLAMLRSRRIADKLVAQYDLKKRYDTESDEKARRMLAERSMIASGKDGLITVEVEDEDPKVAAQLANAYINELISLTKVLAVTEASQRRVFFEQQLEATKNNLIRSELTLKRQLDSHGVISVDGESRAMVETVGKMRAQISAKEIELGSMKAFVTESNTAYKRANQELSSLRAELAKLENGRPGTAASPNSNQAPQVGLKNIQVLRDVRYHQMLYELLAKQYEAARLDEAKDSGTIQVLDLAMEPERKSKPKRVFIGIIAGIITLFATIAWAFSVQHYRRMLSDPAAREKLQEFRSKIISRN